MNVFVTGGSGFVGRSVISTLVSRGYGVHALVNHKSIDRDGVKSFRGGLFDKTALDAGMRGCDAVIHLVGIIAEKPKSGITFDRIHYQGTVQVVDAAGRGGVRRYVHMSALGASADSLSRYHQTKFKAEQYVRNSSLNWTILQPSLIHGPGGDFTQMEQGWARGSSLPFLFMPYFGEGALGLGPKFKVQPVFVEDVARAFVDALEKPGTIGQTYPLGGADQLTWPQMHQIAAKVVSGHSRPTLAIPAWYAKAIARITPPSMLPFTRDQVLMSQQDNVCDLTKFKSDFGWKPQPFEASLRSYA